MTKKRKRYPDLNQKLERPWCYYCERDFDDLKILISHQKAKHFKCDRCGRRLNTAGGLSVHMNQVHKETLSHVENAIPGRQGLDIEIFGMEGVPQEIIDQHNQQVTHKHFEEEQERARISGNPIRGLYSNGSAPPNKRPKVKETIEEIKARAAKFREDRKNGILPAIPVAAPVDLPAQPTPPTVAGFGVPPPTTQAPPFAPGAQAFPPGAPPGFPPGAPGITPPFGGRPFPPGHSPTNAPAIPRPGSIPGAPGFPQPPPYGVAPGHPGFAPPHSEISASVDELISSAAAGTGVPPPAEPAPEKKKKERNIKLVYSDETLSPEEKMAALPRYAFVRS